jgi:hypothetical protein
MKPLKATVRHRFKTGGEVAFQKSIMPNTRVPPPFVLINYFQTVLRGKRQ